MRSRLIRRATVAVSLLALVSCSSTAASPSNSNTLQGSITVGAATSLKKVFTELASAFEAQHAGVSVTLSVASSKDVRVNINNGAPIDVFASADWANMKAVTAPLQQPATEFTTNALAIIVAPGNPKHIGTLSDLAATGVSVATCSDGVPIRTYTDTLLSNNGLLASVTANYNNFAANVAGIVTYVANGGSDAGVVYRTDVLAADSSVEGIALPAAQNVVAHYPIAELASASNHAVAAAFIAFVRSPAGQSILSKFGFGAG